VARSNGRIHVGATSGVALPSVDFDAAFTALIGNEGGYSNNPADPGGETMWGVTARVARSWGYTGAMKDLPLDTAKQIAKDSYWTPVHGDELPDGLRFDVFDTSYNLGVHEAIVLLQRSLGQTPDGFFGPKTQAAIIASNAEWLRRAFDAARIDFYTQLPTWSDFGKGWVRRVAANLRRP
jgi:lysozyme family protein